MRERERERESAKERERERERERGGYRNWRVERNIESSVILIERERKRENV